MNIFITGVTGLIGSNLADRLLAIGHSVRGIDNFSSSTGLNINKHTTRFTQCRVQDVDVYKESVRNSDIIIHLAASMGVKNVLENALETEYNSHSANHAIFNLAIKYKKPIVYASSSEVYCEAECNNGYIEDEQLLFSSPERFRSIYAAEKLVGEYNLHYIHDYYKLPFLILRFFNITGKRQLTTSGMVLPNFIENAKLNQSLSIYGDGHQERTFCDARDCVEIISKLLKLPYSWNNVYNIGSPNTISIGELANLVIRLTNSQSQTEYIHPLKVFNSGFREIKRRKPSLLKLLLTIGDYKFKSIEEIIKDMI